MIGGYFGNTTFNSLTVFDPSTGKFVTQEAATATTSLTDVAAVWSFARNTILTFGGSRAPPAIQNGIEAKNLEEYDPATKGWKTMVTSGSIPTSRYDHCVAASEDGSKVVLFGGSLDTKTYFNDIYILDVKTATWKQGSPASSPRTRMACGFYFGQFIAWGGSSADNRATSMHNNIPIVYSLSTDTWTTDYTTPPSSGPSSGNSFQSKTNLGPIIGGAAAGVMVLIGCIIAIIIVYQRKKKEKLSQASRDDARVAASLTDSEEDHYYRKGQSPVTSRQTYSPTQHISDSDIERFTDTDNERHLGKMRPTDHYAAAETLHGGRDRYSGGSSTAPIVRSGYYDGLTRMDDAGMFMRPLPQQGTSSPVSPNIQDYSRHSNSSNASPTPWSARDQQLQEQAILRHQQQQLLYQQQQQLQREHDLSLYPFKAPYDENRHNAVSNSNSAYPSLPQMSSASPYSQGQYSGRDSASPYSDSRSPNFPDYIPPPRP
ncbi:hypothetical protein BGZ65_011361 [Modicella reniformis]|uniref:Uncharacterized protein n=1 Tax=Modicella reniformis TaxID=1440133 RepID=A0A9P6MJN9_9FUNG|nr:hypothetical protein BGZ65_011361 [Modicella reniformis]